MSSVYQPFQRHLVKFCVNLGQTHVLSPWLADRDPARSLRLKKANPVSIDPLRIMRHVSPTAIMGIC